MRYIKYNISILRFPGISPLTKIPRNGTHNIPKEATTHPITKKHFLYNFNNAQISSVYEGFPMVILEAQSYGLPVISFDCKTGPKDLIENNKTGFLVKDGNVEDLAQKMLEFTRNEKEAEQMSNNVQQSIRKYDLETIILKWCKLIEDIID